MKNNTAAITLQADDDLVAYPLHTRIRIATKI